MLSVCLCVCICPQLIIPIMRLYWSPLAWKIPTKLHHNNTHRQIHTFHCLFHLISEMINAACCKQCLEVLAIHQLHINNHAHTHRSCLVAHPAINNVNMLFSERQPWPEGQTVLLITLIMRMPICWRAKSRAINKAGWEMCWEQLVKAFSRDLNH